MKKNLVWKLLIVIGLVVLAILTLNPPSETLKPGIDLAGGTSLIYEIDSAGLKDFEKKQLAENMISVLRRRIDPQNVQNLIWRPQGYNRVEIQMPLASAEVRDKREQYEKAIEALREANFNLANVLRLLTGAVDIRSEQFKVTAAGDENKLAAFENLAKAYDERKQLREQRDVLADELKDSEAKMEEKGLEVFRVKLKLAEWSKLEGEALDEAIKAMDADGANAEFLKEHLEKYRGWANVVDSLTDPEAGKNIEYKKAVDVVLAINISIEQITDILDMPEKSAKRAELIDKMREDYPGRIDRIEKVIAAYEEYRPFRGRLDDAKDLKRQIKGAGVLEFRILPTTDNAVLTAGEISVYLEKLKDQGPKEASDHSYIWCEIENVDEWNVGSSVVGNFGEKYYVLASNKPEESMLQIEGEKKWKLKSARPGFGQMGQKAINFVLDDSGGRLFFNITKQNINTPLCILLDDVALSAPNINSAISRSGQITGSFTDIQVEDMVSKLNAGSLPARLMLIQEKSIGPSIGADNRDQGIKAGLIGLCGVAVCITLYYLFAGVLANVALFMNLLFILAIMALSRATFTLPGIAGIILTIGMSVDANVLIFERIREEQQRGSSLRIAIQNGYGRAFRTIFDANLTTFITAFILFWVASEEIKGFAITLMLGIVSSMFTALFVTRLFFEILIAKRIIGSENSPFAKKSLAMFQIVKNPSVDWMKARPVFFVISLVLISSGLYTFFTRDDTKNNKYDIEFTGGTSVVINLKEGVELSRSAVEEKIRNAGVALNDFDIAAATVYSVGETGRHYEITTTATNTTTTAVSFKEAGQTVDSMMAALATAQDEQEIVLKNLSVSQDSADLNLFNVSVTQMNKSLFEELLIAAFGEGAGVAEPKIEETVNMAIINALGDDLQLLRNLGPEVTKVEKITEEDLLSAPELADYTGGAKIYCSLATEATVEEITSRLKDMRFKPDAVDFAWYPYLILNSDLSDVDPSASLKEFVYVSVEPEAGYRDVSEDEWSSFVDNESVKLKAAASLETSLPRVTQIDASIGDQAKTRALIAIVLSLAAIVGYIWIRFGNLGYGLASIAALVHDVCIALGAVTACTYIAATPLGEKLLIGDFKIDLAMIAAFLTIIGYSLNDTIVVFDRIRENRGKGTALRPEVLNNSINQTISRTLLTSFTTFIVVVVMYIWGGPALRGFNFAIGLGIIVGTYSSIAIAAPLLLIGTKKKQNKS